jgi:hypothetical protein
VDAGAGHRVAADAQQEPVLVVGEEMVWDFELVLDEIRGKPGIARGDSSEQWPQCRS